MVSFDSACPSWNKFCPTGLSFKGSGDPPAKEEDSECAVYLPWRSFDPGASKRLRVRLQVIFDVLMAQDVDRFVHLMDIHCLNRTLHNESRAHHTIRASIHVVCTVHHFRGLLANSFGV